jgi:hypothetical protein
MAVVIYRKSYHLTDHARKRMEEKGVVLPKALPARQCEVVEVTAVNGRMVRCLVRFSTRGMYDTVFSLDRNGRIPTVYRNGKWDRHRTLKKEMYAAA